MYNADANPLRTPLVLLLVALSVSVGWGIRGQFGHEAGAMIPGALGAIAIAACSRREDWQKRIPHAALLGGIGFGFGGSISYMYPISFTMSGHFPTMYYGFLTTFLEGGLWCALGVAGTALALTADNDRLTRLYRPMLFLISAIILKNAFYDSIAHWLDTDPASKMDDTWHRQENPLYWFDSDWFAALFGVLGVCAYDLWDRRFARGWVLPLLILLGAFGGGFIQYALDVTGHLDGVVNFLVVPQGDLSAIDPATGQPFDPVNLMTNWPQFFGDYPQHVGWLIGAFIGFGIYFAVLGQWRNGSGLFLYMSLGWLISFLVMPVFGSIFMMGYGGFRMTPPRSDDWAGIVGVYLGVCLWTWRNNHKLVTLAATLGFLLGGLAFTTAHILRCFAMIPGNAQRFDGVVPDFWKHYQGVNWHSVMEQSQGFCLGLAMVIALGVVWRSAPPCASGERMPKWTSVFSAIFVMFVLTWLNVVKNVDTWIEAAAPLVPVSMKAPLLGFIELDALTWFNISWWFAAAAFLYVFIVHTRRPLPLLSSSDAGNGHLLHVFVLWVYVLANFMRALPFSEGRLITEWVVFMNACLATALIATLPTASFDPLSLSLRPLPRLRPIWVRGLAATIVLMFAYALILKVAYGGAAVHDSKYAHRRFGPDAIWRTQPILKHGEHR